MHLATVCAWFRSTVWSLAFRKSREMMRRFGGHLWIRFLDCGCIGLHEDTNMTMEKIEADNFEKLSDSIVNELAP
jgi:hypothetical protein